MLRPLERLSERDEPGSQDASSGRRLTLNPRSTRIGPNGDLYRTPKPTAVRISLRSIVVTRWNTLPVSMKLRDLQPAPHRHAQLAVQDEHARCRRAGSRSRRVYRCSASAADRTGRRPHRARSRGWSCRRRRRSASSRPDRRWSRACRCRSTASASEIPTRAPAGRCRRRRCRGPSGQRAKHLRREPRFHESRLPNRWPAPRSGRRR